MKIMKRGNLGKVRNLMVFVLFILVFVVVLSIVSAYVVYAEYAEYNYSQGNITNKAYASSNALAKPPATLQVPNELEFSSVQYSQINLSDNNRAATSSANYKTHRFVFNITQNKSSIIQINISWEGYATGTNAPQRRVDLYVWNFTANNWGTSLANGNGNADYWLNVTLTSGFNDYINDSGYFSFLVETIFTSN